MFHRHSHNPFPFNISQDAILGIFYIPDDVQVERLSHYGQ
jgi:hypothetical protein